MASSLPLTIKVEEDVLPSIIPKRKAAIANIPTRSRFAKARPNIGGIANKSNKTAQPSEPEVVNVVPKEEKDADPKQDAQQSVATSETPDVSSSEIEIIPTVKKEPGLLEKPTVPPKRNISVPAVPRARYQKARPNIAALINKGPKDATHKESSSKTKDVAAPKDSETLEDSAKAPQSSSSTEQTVESSSPIREVEVIREVSSEEPANTSSARKDTTEDHHSNDQLDIAMSDPQVNSSENDNVATPAADNEVIVEEELQRRKEMEKSKKPSVFVKRILCDRSEDSSSSAPPISAPPTPSVSRQMDCPTLKSILNSPRKRTTTKKVYERKRRLANLSEAPSRSEMTMTDLIYFNPTGEPMRSTKPLTTPVENLLPADENTQPPEEAEPEEEEESSAPVPKVIIDENGDIIIDESSLVVRRKETIDTSVEAIIENENTTYSSFRKRSSKQWTNKETSKFYKALSLVGTDFALMENIFTVNGKVTRSRRELKLKFKREEKLRIELVHKAMYETQTYDISILQEDDPEDVMDSEEVDNALKTREPKKRGRKPKDPSSQGKPTALTKKKKTSAKDSVVDENEAVSNIMEFDLIRDESNDVDFVPAARNQNDNSVSQEEIVRPQRVRKTRILSDFVTEEDSDHSEDFLPEREPIAAENRVVHNLENQSNNAEIVNENGQTTQVEKPVKVIRRKKVKILSPDPPDMSDSETANNLIAEAMLTEVSRLGRIRRLKVLPDFITDDTKSDDENDSDTDSVIGFAKRRRVRTLNDDEEYFEERANILQNQEPNSREKASTSENMSLKAVVSSKDIGNLLQFPYQQPNNNGMEDLLTDAVISEVTTTTTKRGRKKAPMPNVSRGRQRPRTEVDEPYVHPPSFTNFTPTEESFASEQAIKTYSLTHMYTGVKEHFTPGQNIQTYSRNVRTSSGQETSKDETIVETAVGFQDVETILPDCAESSSDAELSDMEVEVKQEIDMEDAVFSSIQPSSLTSEPCLIRELRTMVPLQAAASSPAQFQTEISSEDIDTINLDSVVETDQVNTGFQSLSNSNLCTLQAASTSLGVQTAIPSGDIETFTLDSVTETGHVNNLFQSNNFNLGAIETGSPSTRFQSSGNIETITLDTVTETDQLSTGFQVHNSNLGAPFQTSQPTVLDNGALFNSGYQQVSRTDQTLSDPPPVMIFTKSPDNENILHLFLMKSPDHNF